MTMGIRIQISPEFWAYGVGCSKLSIYRNKEDDVHEQKEKYDV